jgi:prevent-host-death family protein
MLRVSVTELKNRLRRYLRLVKQGAIVEIEERSVPIARLLPIHPLAGTDRLDSLIANGHVRRARTPLASLLELPRVPCRGDALAAMGRAGGER